VSAACWIYVHQIQDSERQKEVDMSFKATIKTPNPHPIDMKLEVAALSVSDIDRAKRFYGELGWRIEADYARADGARAVQLTPHGSPTSILLCTGSGSRFYLVVSDIELARAELINRGADVSEPWAEGRLSGLGHEERSFVSLATFRDPDGNTWLIQEATRQLPGRIDANATFGSSSALASALRRAAAAHGEYEGRIGRHDVNWSEWYADYIIGEQSGKECPWTSIPPNMTSFKRDDNK
jgi:catechol 2,3-dioxygenase-like lactoylglutathione lyase family enzyme